MPSPPFAKHLRQSMTEAEHRLWFHLRAHRFAGYKFRRQQPIGPYIVDFAAMRHRLVIEADGGQHNGDARDAQRDDWLTAQGYRVLRFWNHEVLQNTELVLEEIWRALCAGPSPPAPLPQGERGDKHEDS
ncbi:MAG TPA: endonuclease domain-containing protein [Arenimonas sp.]|uniref:endonuclease domain-containing protein n=1 Tax=Arenimonas sp. TaxID=1872635 RepID=UPI002D80F3AE|nr:endonuclease domain-containing protein [Arenimonas sp.]HEU0153010.1 endonuclease domain-containing protein [Arenimonas sp.]